MELLWVPKWANPADAPSRCVPLEEWLLGKRAQEPEGWSEAVGYFMGLSAGRQSLLPGPPAFREDPLWGLREAWVLPPLSEETLAAFESFLRSR